MSKTAVPTCTSGRAITSIDVRKNLPCGLKLIYLRGAMVCPKCDALPMAGAKVPD